MTMWYDKDDYIYYYFEPNSKGRKEYNELIKDLESNGYCLTYGIDISGRYYVKVVGEKDVK